MDNKNGISGNSGYLSMVRETTPGVAVRPVNVIPMYEETLTTELNPNTDNMVFGSKGARLLTTPGKRSHNGDITVMAEPNSTAMFFDGLLPRTGVTDNQDGTYEWAFNSTSFNATSSYTIDVSKGVSVSRFAGVQFSEVSPAWSENRQQWKVKATALRAFHSVAVASVDGAVVTLSTEGYTDKPAELLLVGDSVGIRRANGTHSSHTITDVTDTTVTLDVAPSTVAAGDVVYLRPTTPTLDDLFPFLWSRTEFRWGETATAALAADHVPSEEGSEYAIMHEFEDEKGDSASGSFDRHMLVRSQSIDATIKVNNYYDNDKEAAEYNAIPKKALVVRSFSVDGTEVRLTFNNLACTKGGDKPLVKADEALYYEREYVPNYDRTDGQTFDVKVICKLPEA
ncbi:hypothetical protein [Dietzia sp. MNB45]|uniref:hypothetical protein n=1 Tax=Dietzia sp. MNB45 TaxID=3238800 RepID=UPI003F7E9AA2